MAALGDYTRKRDFTKTPEPPGSDGPGQGNAFVIHKHAATRLHYDLRLELDGVLKSWAVTAGPSLVPGDKKLAIEVEDHPLSYGIFEGNIPQGQYGGGAVLLWDNGTWTPEGDAHAGLAKGHLRFSLSGRKLGGTFDLVRIKKAKERQQPWLLIKVDDAHARGPDELPIVEAMPASVLTGRTIDEIAADGPPREAPAKKRAARAKKTTQPDPVATATTERTAAISVPVDGAPSIDLSGVPGAVREAALPSFIPPALASGASRAPDGAGWVHEIKLDGYRLQARINHGRVQLRTRSGLDWTAKFGPLAEAFALLPVTRAILDGEAVVETENGVTSFAELKLELSRARPDRFLFYAFDILHLDEFGLADASFEDRRAVLARMMSGAPAGRVRLSDVFETDGGVLQKHACRLGLEGIVSKRKSARYPSGRTKSWLKTKCASRDEFVVVGYAQSTVSRRAVGALALAYWRDGALAYGGKVGTGFSQAVAEELWAKLDPLRRAGTPVSSIPADADIKGVRWVEPRVVADVEYRTWTGSGMLRHASFQGLRDDKTPDDLKADPPVIHEEGEEMQAQTPARRTWSVRLTHPDRVYWPDVGVSKLGLAEYYADIWPWIEPYVARRPLSLLRCPSGGSDCFFQKHAWNGFDAQNIHKGQAGDDEFLWIDTLDGLVSLAQAGVLEIHPWGSTLADPESPDMLIFDLDPGEGLAFADVEAAALDVKARLSAIGLTSFVKTTGGKGLHVLLPIRPTENWTIGKTFSQKFVQAMAKAEPGKYLTSMAKAQRGGKIFLDYLRNGRGQTAVGAYSTRARPGAPVSTPIAWEEVGTGMLPAHFTLLNLSRRLDSLQHDPWAGFFELDQALPPVSKLR